MKRLKFFLIVFFGMGILLTTATVFASPAQTQLKNSIDKILTILKDPSLKGEDQTEQRRLSLRAVIDERFSFKKMSQFSLARHWKTITPDQQKQFVKLFGRLLEEIYVSKIESYTDEIIEYTGESVSKRKAKIYSEIITDEIKIPIEYRMFKAGEDTWMVYDMLIEGVSLIKNYRTQFDKILQKNSFETLIEDLRKKIDS
ncbi:MAG: ABC transporter substrate-binding protein [Desulfobacula sp.]|nr:ABC transporter substrate-binding protein [Desulfobacula sp.]